MLQLCNVAYYHVKPTLFVNVTHLYTYHYCYMLHMCKPTVTLHVAQSVYLLLYILLGADHLICGGGGLWFFLRDQTFFFDSQLKRTIFFRPYQKQKIFFSAVKLKRFFSPFISFDSPYTMLSSRGVTTFT